jgi:hypothetical protein
MKIKNCFKTIVITSFSLLILLYLGGCAKTKQEMLDAGMKSMTTQELQTLFSQKRIGKAHNIKKDRWATVTYLPDGSISAIASGNGKTYPGTYTIENNEFCSKMDFRNGKILCSSWIKIDDVTYNLYAPQDGSLVGIVTFK